MSTKYFTSFKEASDFSKNIAIKNGVSISLKRDGDGFVVELPDDNNNLPQKNDETDLALQKNNRLGNLIYNQSGNLGDNVIICYEYMEIRNKHLILKELSKYENISKNEIDFPFVFIFAQICMLMIPFLESSSRLTHICLRNPCMGS